MFVCIIQEIAAQSERVLTYINEPLYLVVDEHPEQD